jgi:hypothetical protein
MGTFDPEAYFYRPPERFCPGCHGVDFKVWGDGLGDGDQWFHCYTCGTEDCVENADLKRYLDGSQPPRLEPPYRDQKPLPREWPWAMTATQIREWVAMGSPRDSEEYRKRLRKT